MNKSSLQQRFTLTLQEEFILTLQQQFALTLQQQSAYACRVMQVSYEQSDHNAA
jgi:hypothetical protein